MIDHEPLAWHRASRRSVYRNAWIDVVEDDAVMPNGKHTVYGIVQCPNAVGVLPFVTDDSVLLVQQWRYVEGRARWEIPTGGRHADEPIEHTAQRELAEEAGYWAGRLEPLSRFLTSKSVVDEEAYLFAAYDLAAHDVAPDDTEFIRRQVFAFDDAIGMVLAGEIVDSMSVIALLLADRQRRLV